MLKNILLMAMTSVIATSSFADVKFKLKGNSNFVVEARSDSQEIFKVSSADRKIYINGVELNTSGGGKIGAGSIGNLELANGAVVFTKFSRDVISTNIDNGSTKKLVTPGLAKNYIDSAISSLRDDLNNR